MNKVLYLIFVAVGLSSCITNNYLENKPDPIRYSELKNIETYGLDNQGNFVVNFRAALKSKKEKDYYIRLPLNAIARDFDADSVQFLFPEKTYSGVHKVYILQAHALDEEGALTLELKKQAIAEGSITVVDSWEADFEIFNRTGNSDYIYANDHFSTERPLTLEIIAKNPQPDAYNRLVLSVDAYTWKNYGYLAVVPFTAILDAVLFVGELGVCAALNMDCF